MFVKIDPPELDQLDCEIKLRKMVESMFNPFGVKLAQQNSLIDEMKAQLILLKKATNENSFYIQKSQKTSVAFEDIFKRIEDLVYLIRSYIENLQSQGEIPIYRVLRTNLHIIIQIIVLFKRR